MSKRQYTMAEVLMLLEDEGFRAHLLTNVQTDDVRQFWRTYDQLSWTRQEERGESTRSRIQGVVLNPLVKNIVGQSRSSIDFGHAMDDGKIVLVRLAKGEIREYAVKVLGSVMVGLIANAASMRPEAKRRPFYLYADEYQLFATNAFAELLSETPKFGVFTVTSHQRRSQLTELGERVADIAAGSVIVFRVTGEDGRELAVQFDRTPTEGEVIGTEAIESISQEPVKHLLSHGHRVQNVRGHAARILEPLAHRIEQAEENKNMWQRSQALTDDLLWMRGPTSEHGELFIDKGENYFNAWGMRDEIRDINKYFVDVMEGRLEPFSDESLARLGAVGVSLRGYIGFASEGREGQGGYATNRYTRRDLDDKTVTALGLFLDSWKPGKHGGAGDTFTTLVSMRYVELDPLLLPGVREQYPKDKVVSPVWERAQAETVRLVEFLAGLLDTAASLQKEPIRVSSGQTVPKYGQRTRADMGDEIADMLSSLPKYTAYCKLERPGRQPPAEYKIETIELPYVSEQEYDERLKRRKHFLRERMLAQGYCRKREDVEQEIAERQRRRRGNGHSEGPTTGGEI